MDSRFLRFLSACILLLTAAAQAIAQDADALSQWLAPYREAHDLPALGAVVVNTRSLQALGVVGQRSVDHEVPVEATDQWHLGSITKSMTATVAARLVDRGLLDFDDSVGELLGEMFPDMHPGYRSVTLRQLLQHRSGLTDDLTALEVWQEIDIVQDEPVWQRHRMLKEVLRLPPLFAPGTDSRYSNAGYVLAGTLLESVSGASWETLLTDELFEPLALHSAGIGPPGRDVETPDQPRGHRNGPSLRAVAPGPYADHPPALAPAGTVHMSLEDLGRYLQLHLTGLLTGNDYLSAGLYQQLHDGARGYALGWFVSDASWSSGKVSSHEGSNTMWMALAWIAPDDDLALAVVTNRVPEDLDALILIALDLLVRQRAD